MNPFEKIYYRWRQINSMAGVGIDPDLDKIPQEIWDAVGGKKNIGEGFSLFCKQIIDATGDMAVDFKINSNFFFHPNTKHVLYEVFGYIKNNFPDVLRVCDGKFSDVGHTAEKLAEQIFGEMDADAVLLNPYMGKDAIEPFIKWKDKITILCINTSNLSATEIQNNKYNTPEPLWKHILKTSMTEEWNYNHNIMPVLSATHPNELKGVRDIIDQIPVLLAGVGAQGGSLKESMPHLLDDDGFGMMISSSRSILYPDRKMGETIGEAAVRKLIELSNSISTVKEGAYE